MNGELEVRHPQIQAPELLTAPERARDTIFTALMWGVYLYLWVPLVSLFAWLLGFEFAYDVMVRSGGAIDLGNVIAFYAAVIAIIFLTVSAWSLGNRLKYGKLRRRSAGKALSASAMAEYFHVDESAVDRLRTLRSVSIEFDAAGHPLIAGFQKRASDAANPATSASDSQA